MSSMDRSRTATATSGTSFRSRAIPDTSFLTTSRSTMAPLPARPTPHTTLSSAGTNNDGVRCRTAPSAGGAVIAVVPEGAIVDLIGAAQGGWQPINCAGTAGYVSTDYVSYAFRGGADFGAAEATGQATVAGTNGYGVNCRTSATTTTAVITTVAEGSVVSL